MNKEISMTAWITRFSALCMACWPELVLADPLDAGEAYTTRAGAPEWMDKVDFGLLLIDYGIFALAIIAMGWLLLKKPQYVYRLESIVRYPFSMIFTTATRCGGVMEFVLQLFGGLAVFVTLAGWIFFCQWLKHQGFGALSMIGLAFAALMLVRIIKGKEASQSI